jgi:Gnt-I system high-affinity gluconate transporter
MPLVIVALAVVLLLLMMTRFHLNGFIALILVAIFVGLAQGMGLPDTYDSIIDGIGGQIDDLALILGFGAMLGRVLADSGGAQLIANRVVGLFGIGRVQLAMVLTAFALGITMFYEVAFVLIIPVVFTIVRKNRLPLLWVGLPMSIALSTMHSFLPPHPGPSAVAGTFHASLGVTLLYGLFIAVPAAALIAFTWPRLPFVRAMNPSIPAGLAVEEEIPEEDLPSFGICLLIVLIPVILMAGSAIGELSMTEDNPVLPYLQFFGEGPIALLVALLIAIYVLGPTVAKVSAHRAVTARAELAPVGSAGSDAAPSDEVTETPPPTSRFDAVSRSCVEAVKPMAIIILIIGAGGAFKQVLVDSGMADYIKDLTDGWDISPIILAWAIAAVLRISLGSATVAVVTAAGVVLPLVQSSGASPELMVLAVSCGSIACSHVNDPGFWLFKEYFNLSVIEAIKARTTYTTALSLLGLGGVLIMSTIVG